MKVLIVDDHPLFRDGVEAALAGVPGLQIVGQAASCAEAVEATERLDPDVVLMDLQLPDGSGLDATRELVRHRPEVHVVVLTMSGDDATVFAALAAGARGYLLKGANRAAILATIEAVQRGEVILGPGVAERVLTFFATAGTSAAPLPGLTEREREVLSLVADGLSNGQIAQRLFIEPKTARNHVSNILTKLGVASRADAARAARDAGL